MSGQRTTKSPSTLALTFSVVPVHSTWLQSQPPAIPPSPHCSLPYVAFIWHDFKVLLLASSWLMFKVITEVNIADPLGVGHNVMMTDVGM